jgi:hypothetical protein
MSDRLAQIEKQLKILHEQRNAAEDQMNTSPDPIVRTQCQQQFQEHSKKVQAYEQEYWQTLANESDRLVFAEPEAEVAIAEIVKEVAAIEIQRSAEFSDEAIQILQELRDKANQPGSSVGKLKASIFLLLPFFKLSYDAEFAPEKVLRTHFPTFTKIIKAAAKK